MKWPVRRQVFVAFVMLLLTSIVLVTAFNVYFAARRERELAIGQVAQSSQMLREANFRLTAKVLDDMKRLTNADFVTWDPVLKNRIATLTISKDELALLNSKPIGNVNSLAELDQVSLNQQDYYHMVIERANPNENLLIHVLYSKENARLLWWQAAIPPLIFAAIALPVVLVTSLWMASKITRPLGKLKQQVDQIARGNREPVSIDGPDDEVRQLSNSVNIMVEQLAAQEKTVRETERLSTLVRMGQGIAHNLRNCATGCRMAIELHENELGPDQSNESLQVARRQLSLMDGYIHRLIRVSNPDGAQPAKRTVVNLVDAVDTAWSLVAPTAEHLNVELRTGNKATNASVYIASEDLEQVIVNLLMNAIQAVSEQDVSGNERTVDLRIEEEESRVTLSVRDSGPGPDSEIADELFKPFISGRETGLGLGLALCHDIVEKVGGSISWQREDNYTIFSVKLPKHPSKST